MNRIKLTLAAGAALLLGAAPAHAQGTVKIGLINVLSGQFADAGIQLDNGIKTYMKQHGDTVAGKKIEIIRRTSAVRRPTSPSGWRRSWSCATASTCWPASC